MTKSRRMKWVGHLAPIGAKKTGYRILLGKSGSKEAIRKT
jgi:hypothetical protein